MKKEEEEKKKKELEEKKKSLMRRKNEFSRVESLEREKKEREEREERERKRREEELSNKTKEDMDYEDAISIGLKKQYIGETEKKSKKRSKQESPFLMEWKNEDDTSEKNNPLYMHRAKVHHGFGKGFIAGMDNSKQQKDSKYNELVIQNRQQSDLIYSTNLNYSTEELNKQLLQEKKKNLTRTTAQSHQHGNNGAGSRWNEKELSAMTERDWRIMREEFDIHVQGVKNINPLRFWKESSIHPSILKAIEKLGYTEPQPIQRQAIPIEMRGLDMIGISRTGSGKTCAFVVPMLQFILQCSVETRVKTKENGPLALVMAPTRELAKQIKEETVKLARYCVDERLEGSRDPNVKVVCIVGGESIVEQSSLTINGCDILIGTPGRLLDCLDNRFIVLAQTNYIVLDEADRMIDEGFEDDVNAILNSMGTKMKEDVDGEMDEEVNLSNQYRTTIMFSATMAPKIELLAKQYMRNPVQVRIGLDNEKTKTDIKQTTNFMTGGQKPAMLEKILRKQEFPAIVFCNKKETVDSVTRELHNKHYRCVSLRGGISQAQREESLLRFKNGYYDILVATNVAARGIDVKGVQLVVNYDMPNNIEDYTHRIGRTGRAGNSGHAISFVTEDDQDLFPDLVAFLKKTNQHVPFELEKHKAVRDANQLLL